MLIAKSLSHKMRMGSYFFRLLCILTLLLSFLKINSQIQGCSFVGLDLQHCLNPYSTNPSLTLDSCCTMLNLAVQAGYHCLCSLLSPSSGYPSLSTTLSLSFSGCYLSIPPLTHCNVLEPTPVQAPPAAAAVPVSLNQPPPSPALQPPPSPAMQPPDLPKDEFVPLPPKVNEFPLINSKHNDSSIVETEPVANSSPFPKLGIPEYTDHSSSHIATTIMSWPSRIFFVAAVCACIA